MQASITRVPFGNCLHSPSICTLTIATGVAVSLILKNPSGKAPFGAVENATTYRRTSALKQEKEGRHAGSPSHDESA
jgi:hypothetical protein